jgi:hypothetical protein
MPQVRSHPEPVHPVFTRGRSQAPIRTVASKEHHEECEEPDRGLQKV